MAIEEWVRLMKRLVLHPVLFAVYPAVALVAANIDQVNPLDALRSALLCIVLMALVLALVWLVFRSWAKAGILTSLIVLPLLSYGHIYRVAKTVDIVGRHRVLLSVWVLALVLAALALWRARRDLLPLTQALNLIAIAALAIPLIEIGATEIRSGSAARLGAADSSATAQNVDPSSLHLPQGGQAPDVYYIILDTYTRQDILMTELNYDNSAFIQQLRDLGFFVADCARSNYLGTELSLSSSLNMQFVDTLAPDLVARSTNVYDLNPYLKHNAVASLFKKLGYRIVGLESGFSPTEWTDATGYISMGDSVRQRLFGGMNPFEILMLRSTMGMFLFGYERQELPYWLQLNLYDQPYIRHRDRILFELSELDLLGSQPGPKFVFVHILAPHDPFVLGPAGEFVYRDYPFSLNFDLENAEWPKYVKGYTGQVTYLNQRVLQAMTNILRTSRTPPVIILQGDHGIPRMANTSERDDIFEAYYFPGDGRSTLYGTITPVNSFRLIFNTYLGGTFPLLPDLSLISNPAATPFQFTQNPETSPACKEH